MKKQLITLLTLGLFAGILGFGGIEAQAETKTSPVGSDFFKDNPGLFSNHYYRLNKKTKVNLLYRAKTDSRVIIKSTYLPKGTVIAAEGFYKKQAFAQGYATADISYHLKRKTVSSKIFGSGDLHFKFKLPTSRLTRIKRPTYALPYGSGVLQSGGLTSIHALPTFNSDALKITSDGWLEYYRYNLQQYPDTDTGLPGNHTTTVYYATKPNSAVKINRSLKKGANVYLYTSKRLAGVTQKKVRHSGAYKYRLTVHNNHKPVYYEDSAYGDDQAASSIYTVGGKQYYTVIAQGVN
ncbi:hypothetical protein [Lentilactobacillus sunkii]|uniref:Uncharacterized protein n=1 Tax=Lentilactobacillus sunkii DSM 19904 TaxID=1423808 RepID=A0A0R1L704_9LACO|nr:hypothetical protein [Lentilactobacillus sunkii]KRK89491.1 hypothetical protein FD17_GL001076 [Lentilactobacillus sunkii DSM 19904]